MGVAQAAGPMRSFVITFSTPVLLTGHAPAARSEFLALNASRRLDLFAYIQ
jgi:hypothetical protein